MKFKTIIPIISALFVCIGMLTLSAAESPNSKITILNHNENNQPVEGVEFQLYSANDQLIDKQVSNKDGALEFQNLPKGEYKVMETKVPSQYLKFSTEYVIQVNQEKQNIQVSNNLKNAKIGFISLRTLNAQKRGITGNQFIIKDIDGNIVDVITTDKDGYAQSIEIPQGIYYVQQSQAASGYEIDPNIYVMYASDNKITTTLTSQIIEKTANFNIRVQDQNGNALSGISFVVKNGFAENIKEANTNENGSANFANISPGAYYLEMLESENVKEAKKYSFIVTKSGVVVGLPTVIIINTETMSIIDSIEQNSSLLTTGETFVSLGVLLALLGTLLLFKKVGKYATA